MDPDITSQIRLWPFHDAPSEVRALFPKGKDADWVVHVAEPEFFSVARHLLLRWRPVFPVVEAAHPVGGFVYWGAESHGLETIVESTKTHIASKFIEHERRRARRVALECPIRYTTEKDHSGVGHTIDLSAGGIAFTTEAPLPAEEQVTLHIAWPIRLEGDVPVELCASGRLVRTEVTKAAMELGSTAFSIAS
jgi:hypothetical protein